MTERASMEGKTDEDLFIDMAFTDSAEDRVNADTAYEELHRRYVKIVYTRCIRMVSKYPDAETLAWDMTAGALARAYERAETYQPGAEGEAGASQTVAWLCRIARNLFLDYRKNPKRPGPLSNVVDLDVHAEQYSPEDFAAFYLEDDSQPYSRQYYRLVAEGFATLDDRTQIVLMETLLQRQRSPGRTYMLRKTAAALAARVGTSTDNVRRIRRLGIQQINAYVDQHKNDKAETDHE